MKQMLYINGGCAGALNLLSVEDNWLMWPHDK